MASETATNAARQAADILRAISDIIAGEGEGEDDASLEKAMTNIGAARGALVKDEAVTLAQAFELGQKLEKAERALQREYMLKHSAGYRRSQANRQEEERLRAANLGGSGAA